MKQLSTDELLALVCTSEEMRDLRKKVQKIMLITVIGLLSTTLFFWWYGNH